MSTPILSHIESKLSALIGGMATSGGYQLNWGSINYEDRALENSAYDAYCIAEFTGEENLDSINDNLNDRYSNEATFTIKIRVPMTVASSNPNKDAVDRVILAGEDIKKLIHDNPRLGSDRVHQVYYKRAIYGTKPGGDRYSPVLLEVYISVLYDQLRSNPSAATA